jgi:hypothetical protein
MFDDQISEFLHSFMVQSTPGLSETASPSALSLAQLLLRHLDTLGTEAAWRGLAGK